MMDYEVFKNVVVSRIGEFLPPMFQKFDVQIHQIPKINGVKEAVILALETDGCRIGAPNVYLDELYDQFKKTEDMDEVLAYAAAFIVQFTGIQMLDEETADVAEYKEDIIMTLINTEKNRELLKNVPHREFLNLSVVYRLAVEDADGNGFATALIDNEFLEDLNMSADELHTLAEENTKRKFKTRVVALAEGMSAVTTEYVLFGAVNLLRPDELHKVAEAMDDDLYIVPDSIHELMAIKAGKATVEQLTGVLRDGNSHVESAEMFLSDNIYYFSRETGEVTIKGL